jgi:putative chitinase
MSISVAQLKRIAPTCKQSMLEALAPAMTENFPKYGVTTRLRVVHFLAQLEHESGDFRYTEEIWGNTPAQQRYDIRPDLGNTPQRDGDGKLYKGHGLIQTTGKHNHEVVTKRLRAKGYNCPDFVKEPAKLAEMPWALLSALEFWDEHSLNALADRDDIDAITKKVNGGTNGLADRKKQLAEAKAVFTSDPFPAGEKPAPAAPVSPAAPSAPTSQVLRKGDKGEAVRQFQKLSSSTSATPSRSTATSVPAPRPS